MNIFKKNNEKKTTQKLPMTGKVQKGFRAYCAVIAAATLVCGMSVTAFAASDPITVVNNLSDFIFGLIRAIGLILLGFGIVQVGLSLKSHDPSQRANGFLTLAGGIIITFYPLCHCQRCDYLRAGAYACPVRHRTRYDFNHYDICGIRYAQSNNFTC